MYIIILIITFALIQANFYSDSIIIKIVPLVMYTVTFLYYILKSDIKLLSNLCTKNKYLIILLILVLIGSLRSNHPDQSLTFAINRSISTFILFALLFLSISYYKFKYNFSIIDITINFIVIPYLIYCLINLLLWLLGVSIQESVLTDEVLNNEAVILSYLGIHIDRVQFPLSTGLNNYAVIVGAMFTITLTLLFIVKSKKYRLFSALSCCVFLLTLLLVDSRACIYYPVLICIIVKLYQDSKKFIRLIPYASYLIIVGPLFLYLLLPLLTLLPFIESMSRNSEELSTGNSRFFIWTACLLEFLDFKPIHLIGYGYFGHFGSGASAAWSNMFSNWNNGDLKTPHNTLFTILFDHGYLGLLVYVIVIYKTLKSVSSTWNFNKEGNIILFSFFAFGLLAGTTETLIGFYSPNYFILFFVFLFIDITGNSLILVNHKKTYQKVHSKFAKTVGITIIPTMVH